MVSPSKRAKGVRLGTGQKFFLGPRSKTTFVPERQSLVVRGQTSH
jgi:hypothetical protein